MKDYKELIKKLEETYMKKLKTEIQEDENAKYIYIYDIKLINNISIRKIENYCDYYYISGNKENEIQIVLIINK